MATNLYLIRHGESVANVEPIIGGMRGDVGLTARGREQAALLEARLRASGFHADALLSSTLPRALQTAEYVSRALGLPITRDDELQELRPGEADGLSHEEFFRRYRATRDREPEEDSFRPMSPGGESWASFLFRAGSALDRIARAYPDQTVAAVCHGGVLEASFYVAFGIGPTGNRVHFAPRNTSITHWRFAPDRPHGLGVWTLITFNDAAHLDVARLEGDTTPAVPTPVDEER